MEKKKRKDGKGSRRKSKEFMDAALDAYIRHLALEKWREINDLRESSGMSPREALREAGRFPERGPYRQLWTRRWEEEVSADSSTGALFEQIETVVREALEEEIRQRKACADPSIEDTLGYKRFIDHALERLFNEAAGTIEEL